MSSRYRRQTLRAGQDAPAFRLKDLSGGERPLEEIVAEGSALLAFFKTTCPVCQFTFPFLERLYKSGMRVFGISQDGASATLRYNQECGVTFPTLLDPAGEDYPASNAFGIVTVPTMFLVGPDGKIAFAIEGFVKRDIESLAKETGAQVFQQNEYVPEWKAG